MIFAMRANRNPVIAAIDDRFERRAETQIGIGDQPEQRAVDGAARGGRRVERRFARGGRRREIRFGVEPQRLDQEPEPRRRFAEHDRRALARENVVAKDLALQGVAIGLDHRQRGRVEIAHDIELRQRPVPLAEHREQLKKKHPMRGLRRVAANLALQLAQAFVEIAFAHTLFCGHR